MHAGDYIAEHAGTAEQHLKQHIRHLSAERPSLTKNKGVNQNEFRREALKAANKLL
jgi:hypothetical protein